MNFAIVLACAGLTVGVALWSETRIAAQAKPVKPATRVAPRVVVPLERVAKPKQLSPQQHRRALQEHARRVRAMAIKPAEKPTGRETAQKSQNHSFRGQYDCDDSNAAIKPGATEACDGVDNDCDGDVDEKVSVELYLDADGDGWGDPKRTLRGCEQQAGYTKRGLDCDDTNPVIYPGAADRAGNGLDENCDGED